MRVDFTKAITSVLERDSKSLLVSGDLGYTAFEQIMAKHPKHFLNAGVAEQNMVGVASGMALAGYFPWVYSIIPFLTIRALEQIRNDVCFHNLPVRLVGNGGGYTYGIMGSTHHALEDLGILKALPNMTLYFPCANDQVEAAVNQISNLKTPSYLRLSVSPYSMKTQPITEQPQTLTRQYHKGNRATIVGMGHAVQIALSLLFESPQAVDADVFAVTKFPFDLKADAAIVESAERTKCVIVLEEHYHIGGMGESLKAVLPNTQGFEIMGAYYFKEQQYGSSKFHLDQCEMSPRHLAERLKSL